MTIEERAVKYADEYVVGDVAIIVDLIHNVAEESYIAGATEQKEIDDKELHQRFEKVLNGQKWDLIDKACEWLTNCLPNIEYITNASAFRQKKEGFIDCFRKAMED